MSDVRDDIVEQGYDSVGAFLTDVAEENDVSLSKVIAEWNEFVATTDGTAEEFILHIERQVGAGREW